MPYYYSDPERENEPHALPDVEVFKGYSLLCEDCLETEITYPGYYGGLPLDCPHCGGSYIGATCAGNTKRIMEGMKWHYAFGFPGCLWDSDPVGPFDSEEQALAAAREFAE